MKTVIAVIALLVLANPGWTQSVDLTSSSEGTMIEGRSYTISWRSEGVGNVRVVAYGVRTPLGGESRGGWQEEITGTVPAQAGQVVWTVPWLDSINFNIAAVGYDLGGRDVASDIHSYVFRPAAMANRTRDGIYLDLSKTINQRLYVQKGGVITQAYLSSSSAKYYWLPPGVHTNKPHDHAGVFKVIGKEPNHYSALFRVDMPWAMRYLGGHYIHATSPNQYFALGGPASSGCNRLTWSDAYELYHSTPIGTRVEVIGPNG